MSISLDTIKQELRLAESQLSSFNNKKTKVSATRARAHLLTIVKQCGTLRRAILAESKVKPVKEVKEVKPVKETKTIELAEPVEQIKELELVEEPEKLVVHKVTKPKRKKRTKKVT